MTDLARDGNVSPLDTSARDGVRLGRITQRTTPWSVASVLRTAILDGTLKPGSQLRETHLAADLGVSRAPLREALGIGPEIFQDKSGAGVMAQLAVIADEVALRSPMLAEHLESIKAIRAKRTADAPDVEESATMPDPIW